MSLITDLQWRYATKRMNGEKVPDEKLGNILSAIRLSPSSLGLQPYRIYVVGDEDKRKEIFDKSCHQPQITEGSHLLVFAVGDTMTAPEVEEHIRLMAEERQVLPETLGGFKDMVSGFIRTKQAHSGEYLTWAAKQAYISLGIGLAAAAEQKVDATPMEGFNADAMDEILGLKEKGLHSVVLLMLGYRDEKNDYLAGARKVRKPLSRLFVSN
jgi:nitroreductase / dihydropteridine reductase